MASKPSGNPVGRPTKYDPKAHLPVIRKLAERGLTEEEMAGVLGVATSTLSLWKVEHPEFSEAIREGKQNPVRVIEESLYHLAKGYTYSEMGIERTKHPDVRAIQFYLKNVAPDKWRDKQEIEHSGGISINPPSRPLTPEEAKLLEGMLIDDG